MNEDFNQEYKQTGIVQHRFMTVKLCENDLKNMCGRYHFEDTGFVLLQKVYRECFAAAEISVYYREYFRYNHEEASDGENNRIVVVMTLGQQVDDEQQCLMAEERLSEAYAIECLSMELLSKAYEELEVVLYEETAMQCERYIFPGSDCPIEENLKIMETLKQSEVCCNEAFALIPQKSVVYIMEMRKEKQDEPSETRQDKPSGRKLCAACSSRNCPNREKENAKADHENQFSQIKETDIVNNNYNYGYQRIFGKCLK